MNDASNHKYLYEGPVLEFDRVVAQHWSSTTYAPSEKRARSNLTYQYKKQNSKLPNTRIDLPGEIKLIG